MDNATTLLLNADNGDIVAHFIERDEHDLNFGVPSKEPDLLIMQPARALGSTLPTLSRQESTS